MVYDAVPLETTQALADAEIAHRATFLRLSAAMQAHRAEPSPATEAGIAAAHRAREDAFARLERAAAAHAIARTRTTQPERGDK